MRARSMIKRRDVINIIKKVVISTIAFLCLFSISESFAQNVQTDTVSSDASALLGRAQQLASQETLTGSEYAELEKLIKAASNVPKDKRNQATQELLNNYDAKKKHSLMVATEARNKARDDYNNYVLSNTTQNKNASQINPQVELQNELEYRELLLRRAQEDLDTKYEDNPELLALLKKKEELDRMKQDNSWIYDESASSYSAPSLLQMSNAMNASTDRNRASKDKIKKQIEDLEHDVERMEENLSDEDQFLYTSRKQEDEYIEASQIKADKNNKLQQKYCGDKSPEECHWADYATTMEIEDYRDASFSQMVTAQTADPCSTSCTPKCYYDELKDRCPFCNLFRVAFNVSSNMAYLSINTFSAPFAKIVIVGFAIWIALQVLSFVSSITMVNLKNIIQPILTQALIVAFAFILLKNGVMDFFNLALEPVYNTGMTIAQKTITIDDVAKAKQAEEKGNDISDIQVACVDDPLLYTDSTNPPGALPVSMGNNILCTMKMLYVRAAKIKALGSASICYSWKERAFIIPHMGYFMTGIGLWIGAMFLILAVPFMMIDSVLQLAVASALLPLAVAAYAFKSTRKHTKAVWETFLNSMFSFIFVCLIALMLTLGFEQILLESTSSLNDVLNSSSEKVVFEELLKSIPWWGTSFLKVVFITILAWAMLQEALDFASDFSSTLSKTDIGSQIATMGGSFVKESAVRAGSATVEAGWQVAKDAGSSTYRGVRNLGRRSVMAAQGRYIRNNAVNVKTDQRTGVKTYTDASGNRVTYGSDGSMESVIRVKQRTNPFTGRTTTIQKAKTQDVSITTMDITNSSGAVVGHREVIRLNSTQFNNLTNANGAVNNATIDAILAATPEDMQNKVQIAIAKEIINQRNKNLGLDMRKHDFTNQEILLDEQGRFIGFTETLSNGSKMSVRLKTGQNGRMLSEITMIDKKGRGQSLRTDGIINSRSKFVTEDGTVNGKIDTKSAQTIYSTAGRYRGIKSDDPHFRKILEEECLFEDNEIKEALNAADANDLDMYQFKN